jgi:uncharacterized membrane protein YfhO
LVAESKWRPGSAFVSGSVFKPEPGEIHSVHEGASSFDLDVDTSGTSFLVVSVTRDRHWRASIDGRQARIQPANLAYMGLVVPPGARRISFKYSNPAIKIGVAVSGVSLLIALVVIIPRRNKAGERSWG